MVRFLIACFVLGYSPFTFAVGAEEFHHSEYKLGPSDVKVLEQEISSSDFENYSFLKSLPWAQRDKLNFGYNPGPKLFKFSIENIEDDFLIRFNFPMLQELELAIYKDGVLVHRDSGRKTDYHSYRAFESLVSLRGNVEVMVLTRTTGALQFSVHLLDQRYGKITAQNEYLFFGTLLGILVALICYNLFLFISLRNPMYAFYCLYGVFLGIINFSFNGIFLQYFSWLPDLLLERSVVLSAPLMVLSLTLFTTYFFGRENIKGITKYLLVLVSALALFHFTSALVDYSAFVIKFTGFMGILAPLTMLLVSLERSIRRDPNSKLYALATGSVLIGIILYALKDMSHLPNTVLTEYSMQVFSSFEMIILSFALARKVKLLQEENRALALKELERQKTDALTELAKQVAHDIRSPLMAMRVAVSELPDSGSRGIIDLAARRIDGIASELLSGSKNESSIVVTDLSRAIIEAIEEKRTELQGCSAVDLDNIVQENFRAALSIPESSFKRVLSNILNNAIEACEDGGRIRVEAKYIDSKKVEIVVSDNGRGIPNTMLSRVGQKGFSFGKRSGSGLGLSDAVSKIEAWGGSLKISSQYRMGTTIKILLPCS